MEKAKNKCCKICDIKPYIWGDGTWVLHESSLILAEGPWTTLYACKDRDGRTALYGVGDDFTDLYYPKYCPECGRKLKSDEDEKGGE